MKRNTAIAIALASIFLGLGIAAAGGASPEAIGTIAMVGLFIGFGLVVRLDLDS